MKTQTGNIYKTVLAVSIALFAIALADVPIQPVPTNYVECTCVTSAVQTCVTQQGGSFLGTSLNSSCVGGVYSAVDASKGASLAYFNDPTRVYGNISELYRTTVANGFTAGNGFFTLSGSPVFPIFQALQNCNFNFLSFDTTCTPIFPENLDHGSLGSNSGVPCKRASGFIGTIHYTGYVITVNAINTLPSGFGGIGGSQGNTSGGVGTINFPPVVSHYNYSCY